MCLLRNIISVIGIVNDISYLSIAKKSELKAREIKIKHILSCLIHTESLKGRGLADIYKA